MKYLSIFIIPLVAIYYLFLTPSGNSFTTPYLKTFIAKKSPKNLKIELINYRLTGSNLKANFLINDTITTKVYGEVALFDGAFDLDYHLYASTLKVENFITTDKIKIKGKIKGDIDNFEVDGKGEALNSDVSYRFEVDKKIIKDIHVSMGNASVKNLLYLAGVKPYVDGKFDLFVDMPSLDIDNLNGFVKLIVEDGRADERLVYKDFNITLEPDFSYKLKIASKLKESLAIVVCNLNTTLANLFFQEAKVDIKNRVFDGEYKLNIPDLSRWKSITKRALQGGVNINGRVQYDSSLIITALSDTLGGKIESVLKDSDSYTTFEQVPLSNILYLLAFSTAFEGDVWGSVEYNILNKSGKISSQITDARFLQSEMTSIIKKYIKKDLTQEKFDSTVFEAVLDKKVVVCDFLAENSNTQISIQDAKISKLDSKIDAKFNVRFNEKDFSGTITGDLTRPNIQLDTLKYLRNEVEEIINNTLDEDTKKQIDDTLENLGIKRLIPMMF